MWGSKWTCISKRRSPPARSARVLVQRQEVEGEADEFAHDTLFVSSADGLCRWPELQTPTGLGAETMDGCARPWVFDDVTGDRRVVVVVSRRGVRLANRAGRGP